MQRVKQPEPQGMEDGAPSRRDRMREVLQYDLPASLVVFLVALPLSLGIAIASDAPVLAGLIAAIVGGVVGGWIGGSPLQVSGPAAGLTVVVAELVSQFGWAITCFITVIAGVLQVLLGFSRIARAALAISPVVVHAIDRYRRQQALHAGDQGDGDDGDRDSPPIPVRHRRQTQRIEHRAIQNDAGYVEREDH